MRYILPMFLLAACQPIEGPAGPQGPPGVQGEPGPKGDPGMPGKDVNASGSRLKARYLVSEGARQFLGWWDSERSEECALTNYLDGKWRCLPKMADRLHNQFFYDSDCRKEVYALGADRSCGAKDQPKYFAWRRTCPDFQIFQVSSLIPRDKLPAALYQKYQGTCTNAGNNPPLAELNYYENATEIPIDEFATADLKTE